jgi:hypothetical protein
MNNRSEALGHGAETRREVKPLVGLLLALQQQVRHLAVSFRPLAGRRYDDDAPARIGFDDGAYASEGIRVRQRGAAELADDPFHAAQSSCGNAWV